MHAAYLLTYRFKTRGREPSKSSGSYAALSWITNWIIDSLVPSLSMIPNNDEQEYRCIDFSMKNLALYFCEHLRFDWRFSFKRFEIWGKMGIFYSFFFPERFEMWVWDFRFAHRCLPVQVRVLRRHANVKCMRSLESTLVVSNITPVSRGRCQVLSWLDVLVML